MPRPPGLAMMPLAACSLAGRWVMSSPSKNTAPFDGSVSPAMARSRVDLPAPLVPSSARTSPSSTSKSTLKRTWTSP